MQESGPIISRYTILYCRHCLESAHECTLSEHCLQYANLQAVDISQGCLSRNLQNSYIGIAATSRLAEDELAYAIFYVSLSEKKTGSTHHSTDTAAETIVVVTRG